MMRFLYHVITALVLLMSYLTAEVTAESQDLTKHPVYSRYEFGRDAKIIDIATQPLAVPIGVTSEVMKRDRVLLKALGELGMEIRLQPFMKGADINFFMKRGDVEVAMAGDMPVITIAAETGITVTALAKRGFSSIVSRGYLQISELKGKRIGYTEGSTAHYALLIALLQYGMSEADIVMVPLDVDKLIGALENGKIDAFSAYEPIPSMALAGHKDFTVIMRFLNSTYLYFSKSFIERNRDAASVIIASHVRALRWMNKDRLNLLRACEWARDSAKTMSGMDMDLSAEKIAEIVKTDILNIVSSPLVPRRDLADGGYVQRAFELLKKQKKIPPSVPLETVLKSYDNSIITDVLAHPGKFRLNEFDYE